MASRVVPHDRLAWLTFDRFLEYLFLVAVAVSACLMPAQNDTWWHLRAGEDIWRTGGVPLRDTFSHTVYGTYWTDLEWLGEAIFYGSYRVGGLPLMTAMGAVIATVTWAIVWRMIPGPRWIALVLAAIAAGPVSAAWSIRPSIFTLLMLVFSVYLIERGRLWSIPFVFILWANLHGGFALGLICLGASSLWAAVNRRELLPALLALIAVSALATNVTPLGFSEWSVIAHSMGRIRQYPISEWRPPGLFTAVFLPFWIIAAVLVALAIRRKVWRPNPSLSGVVVWSALALLPLAVEASRNVAPFLLLAVPAVALLFDRDATAPSRHEREHPFANAVLLVSVAGVGSAIVVYAWVAQIPRLGWHPLPQEAIAAVRACPDNLYNRWDEGGFLVWFTPERKVFIDGRQDPYPPDLVAEHMRVEANGEYTDLFARYGIRCAFLPESSPVARRLIEDGWKRRYGDDRWLVLVKP